VTFRHFLSWKPLFYNVLLPALRMLGPTVADRILVGLGQLFASWPVRRKALTRSLINTRSVLDTDWDIAPVRRMLAANIARAQARDYLLDIADDARAFSRFDVKGFEHLQTALARGRGVILLGSHLGAYLAALHWILRREIPLRLLVQEPRHVSRLLHERLCRTDGPHPQSSFFLRRGLAPAEAAARMLRARDALRDGLAIYFSGDVPWDSVNARRGRLLGSERTFLSVWADLALVARSPVVPVFCTHQPGGRFDLTFDPAWEIPPGGQYAAVARYLARLESEIRAHPAEAVAHLTWPCYAAGDSFIPRTSHNSHKSARVDF
jgi:phosphatidylinositol dimannoside acyltransferase